MQPIWSESTSVIPDGTLGQVEYSKVEENKSLFCLIMEGASPRTRWRWLPAGELKTFSACRFEGFCLSSLESNHQYADKLQERYARSAAYSVRNGP